MRTQQATSDKCSDHPHKLAKGKEGAAVKFHSENTFISVLIVLQFTPYEMLGCEMKN